MSRSKWLDTNPGRNGKRGTGLRATCEQRCATSKLARGHDHGIDNTVDPPALLTQRGSSASDLLGRCLHPTPADHDIDASISQRLPHRALDQRRGWYDDLDIVTTENLQVHTPELPFDNATKHASVDCYSPNHLDSTSAATASSTGPNCSSR